ncbi:hypothetical protein D5F11_011370 [Siminovitchia terrae]|uniref:Uncharacterized protein n=1 Tax=Siminovitchia terrae TaxID=1914933 RepID=A0A429X8H0_SIMTE|nr:hypothetical protein [Siminovitchia terrae]RST59694.1 hypothetical protein D5F11_011370 [Siminovitchia terrae]
MSKSKLEMLVDDQQFGVGNKSVDTGIMINDHNDAVDYLILEFNDRFEVYLNLYDENEPPYRNILTSGKSRSLEVAKKIAVRKLNKLAYS